MGCFLETLHLKINWDFRNKFLEEFYFILKVDQESVLMCPNPRPFFPLLSPSRILILLLKLRNCCVPHHELPCRLHLNLARFPTDVFLSVSHVLAGFVSA